jgi:hypothetical protein
MKYRSILAFFLLALSSCFDIFGPGKKDEVRISGLYTLREVDGLPVPASIAPQMGCDRTVRAGGILTISARGSETQPMYDWSFAIDASCQPVPKGVFQGDDDVGQWQYHSRKLSFISMMGHGAYTAALEESAGNPPAITVTYLGNAYRFVRLMKWDDPQGVVYVRFVDQLGQPVRGVVMMFTFANGLIGGGTTPDSGEFGTRGVVGECKIKITPPEGYEVPASQPNPFSVSVVEDPVLHVQVLLTRL